MTFSATRALAMGNDLTASDAMEAAQPVRGLYRLMLTDPGALDRLGSIADDYYLPVEGSLYIGASTNLRPRIKQHLLGPTNRASAPRWFVGALLQRQMLSLDSPRIHLFARRNSGGRIVVRPFAESLITAWLHQHVRVVMVPVPEGEDLTAAEAEVIAEFSPMFNVRLAGDYGNDWRGFVDETWSLAEKKIDHVGARVRGDWEALEM